MNTELLEQTMQHIKDHPEQHRQSIWVNSCGTSACFAGWAALLSGMDWAQIIAAEDQGAGGMHAMGAELLGISIDDAYRLFDGQNTLRMLELMVKDLLNGQSVRPQYRYQREYR